jgi:hypothetical protein
LPGIELETNQLSSMSMPPNIVPAAGLLTTIPTQQGTQATANAPINTAYPLNQAALYYPQPSALVGQIAQPDPSVYNTAATQQQLNALSLQQQYQQGYFRD